MLDLFHRHRTTGPEDIPMPRAYCSPRRPSRGTQPVPRALGTWGLGVLLTIVSLGAAKADEHQSGQVQIELAPGVSIATINARYGTTTDLFSRSEASGSVSTSRTRLPARALAAPLKTNRRTTVSPGARLLMGCCCPVMSA